MLDAEQYIKDAIRALTARFGNFYHALCHRYVHADKAKNLAKLPQSAKAVFFLLQDLYAWQSGVFEPTKEALRPLLTERDRQVLELAERIRQGETYDFDGAFDTLFTWCRETMNRL